MHFSTACRFSIDCAILVYTYVQWSLPRAAAWNEVGKMDANVAVARIWIFMSLKSLTGFIFPGFQFAIHIERFYGTNTARSQRLRTVFSLNVHKSFRRFGILLSIALFRIVMNLYTPIFMDVLYRKTIFSNMADFRVYRKRVKTSYFKRNNLLIVFLDSSFNFMLAYIKIPL